ncbi:hypothetical protein DUNSADRAFT_18312, partial [Dunaliella salina]
MAATLLRRGCAMLSAAGMRPLPQKYSMLLSPFRMSAPQPCLSSSRAMAAKAKGGKSAPVPEPTSVDELADYPDDGEFDPMDGLSAGVRRRVMALKELQDSYDANSRSYQQELAQLQSKYLQKSGQKCVGICHVDTYRTAKSTRYLGIQHRHMELANPTHKPPTPFHEGCRQCPGVLNVMQTPCAFASRAIWVPKHGAPFEGPKCVRQSTMVLGV